MLSRFLSYINFVITDGRPWYKQVITGIFEVLDMLFLFAVCWFFYFYGTGDIQLGLLFKDISALSIIFYSFIFCIPICLILLVMLMIYTWAAKK